jgi:trehalose 6-phosphate phosphatase
MTGSPRLGPDLMAQVARVAQVRRLLVVVDVDGTIAEIAPRPQDARVLTDAPGALERLARLDGTTVAVLSGRSHDELVTLLPPLPGVLLVGSHGAERGGRLLLDPDRLALRERLIDLTRDIVARTPGAIAEVKPTGAALHVRLAEPELATASLEELRRRAEALPGVHVRPGKQVMELSVVATGKGECLRDLRTEHGSDAVVFVGDDDTDEQALARLGRDDLGVRVGPGSTHARARVDGPSDVVALLDLLADDRGRARATG